MKNFVAFTLMCAASLALADKPVVDVLQNPYAAHALQDSLVAAEAARHVAEVQAAEGPTVKPTGRSLELAEQLARAVGAPRGWVLQCHPFALRELRDPGTEGRAELTRALAELEALAQTIDTDVEAVDAVLAHHQKSASEEQARQLAERRETLQKRHVVVRALAQGIAAGLERKQRGYLGRLSEVIRGCVSEDATSIAARLREDLSTWGAVGSSAVLGVADLTYNVGGVPAPTLPQGSVTPSYGQASVSGTTIADVTAGHEVVLTPSIIAKATQLGSPAAAYDFVKNDLALDWSYGAMKRPDVTLASGRGNPAELSGLLIALLRAQNVPARYVWGTITLSVERLAGTMGLLTTAEADAFDSGATFALDASRRSSVLAALTAAGVPYVVSNGDVQLGHVWVEAYLPYGSYRGAAVGKEASQWVSIEPSFGAKARLARVAPQVDVFALLKTTAKGLTDDYLAQPRGQGFLEYVRARVTKALADSGSSSTVDQVLGTVTRRAERLGLIPGSLPYPVVAVAGEASFLPDTLVHQVHFDVSDATGSLFSATLPLHQLTSQRTVLTFKPATQADEVLVSGYGSLYDVPASTLNLLPVLRVNGTETVVATRALSMGSPAQFVTELVLPSGERRRIENELIFGNVVALGFAAPSNAFVEGTFPNDADGAAEKWLYARAADYATRWTAAEEQVAGLLGLPLVRLTPNVVLVDNQLAVEESLGVRTHVSWNGVQVDADLRTTAPIGPAQSVHDFMRLSGFAGSSLEASVLVAGTGEDSISTTGVLQEAQAQGVPILTITEANAATQLPSLAASPGVLREVSAALSAHREVRIPLASLTVKNWTGTGFTVRDPATEEASYFLSGVVSGGQTVVSPQFWADQALVKQLESPGALPPVTDTSLIARIVKVPGYPTPTTAKLDDLSPRVVKVYVTTIKGNPVFGAAVTFRADGQLSLAHFVQPGQQCPGTSAERAALPTTQNVVTSISGIATAYACPETNIAAFFLRERTAGGFDRSRGVTDVQAETVATGDPNAVGIRLGAPFEMFAYAGPVSKLTTQPSPEVSPAQGVSLVSPLWVRATDLFDNAVPGETVTWSQDFLSSGTFMVAPHDGTSVATAPVVLNINSPDQRVSLTDVTDFGGFSYVIYITPNYTSPCRTLPNCVEPPGPTVTVFATTSTQQASYQFALSDPALLTRIRMNVDPSGTFHTEMSSAILINVFRRSLGWEALSEAEMAQGKFYASYTATDETGRRVDTRSASAADILPSVPQLDDAATIAFWPRYLVRRGIQQVTIAVRGNVPPFGNYERDFNFAIPVAPARLTPIHQGVGTPIAFLPPPPAPAYLPASDTAAGFYLENPGSIRLYLVVEQPTPPALAFGTDTTVGLTMPGTVQIPGLAGLPNGLPVLGLTGTFFTQAILRPGAVRGTVYAAHPSQGPSAFERLLEVEEGYLLGSAEPSSGTTGLDDGQTIVIGSRTPGVAVSAGSTPINMDLGNGTDVVASITFPVRTVANQKALPPQPPVGQPDSEDPIPAPGQLNLQPSASGDIRISVGQSNPTVVAQGRLTVDPTGLVSQIVDIPGLEAISRITTNQFGQTYALLYPNDPAGVPVDVEFTPADQSPAVHQAMQLQTVFKDLGVMPLGQTFVKDVSIADGHLVKQFTDLDVPGRMPLQFSRTYSSNGTERSPLGMGWNHSYRIYLQEYPMGSAIKQVVVGGSGGGQAFTCGASCAPQRGYHGTLQLAGQEWVYKTKGGVTYFFSVDPDAHNRRWVTKVVDAVGRVTTFAYENNLTPYEVTRVTEPAGPGAFGRYLEFSYDLQDPGSFAVLKKVELKTGDPANSPTSLGLCLKFDYNTDGNLMTAGRGPCVGTGESRSESFTYVPGAPTDALKSNLQTYTDANGNTTTFDWLGPNDSIFGAGSFALFTPQQKAERVKTVTEQPSYKTKFEYRILQAALPTPGFNFQTIVTPARSDMQGDDGKTVYVMDAYGSTSGITRPLVPAIPGPPRGLTSSQQFDPATHLLASETDARGRVTKYGYDTNGNLKEKTVLVPVLAGTPGGSLHDAPATSPTTDGSAAEGVIAQVTESWVYDGFAQWTCHVDAEGRVESRKTDTATGLVTESRRHASSTDCALMAPSPSDSVTTYKYFNVNTTQAAAGAIAGDLVVRTDPNGGESRVTKYDLYGNPTIHTRQVDSSGAVITSFDTFDDRSRLTDTSDSVRHHSTTVWDELDRPRLVEKLNEAPSVPAQLRSPGSSFTYTYFPGGQKQFEVNNATSLSREFKLDGLNRVVSVTETGGQLPAAGLTSIMAYDEHSNLVAKTDRRGVATFTEYDFADRPIRTLVALCDAAQTSIDGRLVGGNTPSSAPKTCPTADGSQGNAVAASVTGTTRYDDAGNKFSETNAQGNETVYHLDSLYRVVDVLSPSVLDENAGSTTLTNWVTHRRYDRTNKLRYERDGNLKEQTTTYDLLGRLKTTTDTAGRVDVREYGDLNDNVTKETYFAPDGFTTVWVRQTSFDKLNRTTQVTQTVSVNKDVKDAKGVPVGAQTYVTDTRYDDTAGGHSVATRDSEGFVSVQFLDGLDRAYQSTSDTAQANGLARKTSVDPLTSTPLELSSQFKYDANNNRTHTIDALLRDTIDTYDGLSRRVARARPMGVTERYSPDGEGRVFQTTDGRGITRKSTFDLLGRQVGWKLIESISNGSAELLEHAVTYVDLPDSLGLTRRVDQDAKLNSTKSYVDALGRTVRVDDPTVLVNSVPTTFTAETRYDAKVKRTEVDRNGFKTAFTYDDAYRLHQTDDFETASSTTSTSSELATFDDVALTVVRTDRSGIVTAGLVDGLGRIWETSRGTAPSVVQVENHVFDGLSREVSVTDANGHSSTVLFDGAGRKVRARKAAGTPDMEETVSTFDLVGNLLTTRSLRVALVSQHTYDDLNRDVRIEDATGKVTTQAFDQAGNLRCVKQMKGGTPVGFGQAGGKTVDELLTLVCAPGFTTSYSYDEENKETQLVDANGNTWNFVYDVARNLVAKQDANSHLTTFGYDARNKRVLELQHLADPGPTLPTRAALPSETAPNAGYTAGTLKTLWAYDGNGNASSETDALGRHTEHLYGLLNRLKTTTYSQHVLPRVLPSIDGEGYTYTKSGQLKTVTETKTTSAGQVSELTVHSYDPLERRNGTTRYDGQTLTYDYDTKGNRTLVQDSTGESTTYLYDAADRLKTASTPAGVATYLYYGDGLLDVTTHAAGAQTAMTETRTYDDGGRLLKLETRTPKSGVAPLVARFEYGYDDNGNRNQQLETRGGAATETTAYGYDDADRLVGVQYPERTELYRLDPVGNRVGEKKAVPGVVAALTVAAFAALTPATALASIDKHYNAVDWLTTVTPATGPVTTLTYDAAGERVAEGTKTYAWDIRGTLTQVTDGVSVVGTYDYDAQLQRVKADTASGHVEYVLDGMYVVQESGARTSRYHYGDGKGLSVGDGNGPRWLLNDGLGSVSAEVSPTGQTVVSREYDAWGNYRAGTTPAGADARLGFTGHQYDVESGLTYARARYYDSVNGVFLSRDTVEGALADAPSLHRYAYAHENPLRFTDPTGRCIFEHGFWACTKRQVVDQVQLLIDPPKFGPQPAEPVQTAMVAAVDQSTGGMTLSQHQTWDSRRRSANDSEVRDSTYWSSTQAEQGAYDIGEATGFNHLVRAKTRESETGRALSSHEVAENAVEGGQRLVETTADVAMTVDSLGLSKSSVGKAAEKVGAEEADVAGQSLAKECPGGECGIPGGHCFVAGTKVLTTAGLVEIERVTVGATVYSRDPVTGASGWKPVLQTFVTKERQVLRLRLEGDRGAVQEFTVTPTHPFWVEDVGWVTAGDLQIGQSVALASGGWIRVSRVTWLQGGATVYNFEVADWHTYFVGEANVWVHNAGGRPCPPGSLGADAQPLNEVEDTWVYVHTKDGEITYVGITEDAERRAAEHALDATKTGDTMAVVNGPLSHGDARTIEAKLIRERLLEAQKKGLIKGDESVAKQLEKAGLDNKNRGRDPLRWTKAEPELKALKDGDTFKLKPDDKK